MKGSYIVNLFITLVIVFSFAAVSDAKLYVDSDLGLAYDSNRDITIMLDANAFDRTVPWAFAVAEAPDFEYAGYTGWRLPSAFNSDGSGPCVGYNCDSELGHIFYNLLGFKAVIDGDTPGEDCGLIFDEIDPFFEVRAGTYWLAPVGDGNDPWFFNMRTGFQSFGDCTYAWYVQDGNIAGIPEPATLVLLGAGVLGLAGWNRFAPRLRRKKQIQKTSK